MPNTAVLVADANKQPNPEGADEPVLAITCVALPPSPACIKLHAAQDLELADSRPTQPLRQTTQGNFGTLAEFFYISSALPVGTVPGDQHDPVLAKYRHGAPWKLAPRAEQPSHITARSNYAR